MFFIPIQNNSANGSGRSSANITPVQNSTSPYSWDHTITLASNFTNGGQATPNVNLYLSDPISLVNTPTPYPYNRLFNQNNASSVLSPARTTNTNTPTTQSYNNSVNIASNAKVSPQRTAGVFSAWSIPTDETSKFRQLPCKTFVSVGACPYRDRCVYLHDPRIKHADAKTKTRKKNKEDNSCDSFFWPVMEANAVRRNLDSSHQPMVVQPYILPNFNPRAASNHDRAVFSMWTHFVDYCHQQGTDTIRNDDELYNRYISRPRLQIFIVLAHGTSPRSSYYAPTTTSTPSMLSSPETASIFMKPSRLDFGRTPPMRFPVDVIDGDSPVTVTDIDRVIAAQQQQQQFGSRNASILFTDELKNVKNDSLLFHYNKNNSANERELVTLFANHEMN